LERGSASALRHTHGGDVATVFFDTPERWLAAFTSIAAHLPRAEFAYELCVRKIADKDIKGIDLSSCARAEWR